MDTQVFKKYAEIKMSIKMLEEQADELSKKVLQEMQKAEVDKVDSPLGKFTVCVRTSWTYSPKVKKMEEDVKIAKIKEVEQGKAKAKESNYLLFKTNENL